MTNRAGRLLRAGLLSILAAAPAMSRASAIDRVAWIDALKIPPGVPLVTLPRAAGAVIGVDEQRKINSFVQTITLQGDPGSVGENTITVTVTRDGLAPRIGEDVIFPEMAERLPSIAMALGTPGTRNVFGLFGYAIGSQGSLTCLYGWQGVNLADRWIDGKTRTPLEENHALSIRVRLCRTGLDADALTAMMEGLQSRGFAGQRMVRVPMSYDALSAAGAIDGAVTLAPGARLLPMPASLMSYGEPVFEPVRARPARYAEARPARYAAPKMHRHRRRASVTAEPVAPSIAPMAGMPTVPLPK